MACATVGFAQFASGHRVVGGQISFWFKHDRLFVVSSQALPNVAVPIARTRIANLPARATATIRDAVTLPSAPVTANGDDVVLPLIGDSAVLGYRVVSPYMIDGGADGRYLAYVDPATASVIAVHQLNDYATGTVLYNGVVRWGGRGRTNYPAARAHVTVAGSAATTAQDGTVSWADGQVPVETSTDGDLVTIVDSVNPLATADLAMDPDGQIEWDPSAVIENDAQVSAFINANLAKAYVRANVDPAMPTLDDQLKVNVNLAQDCNAFFDGSALNFFHRAAMCENTALIQDVVFHEYGHRVHTAEIIVGVGSFDGAMSEGVADFLAASIDNDSGMGRGFFFTDVPLRELDPVNSEWRWPVDIGEIHHTGMIIGGTLWDLRKDLITQFGAAAGIALTNKLYAGALRTSVDIPTTLLSALAADDDDGDLSNGTPHECSIRNAWGRHGLRTVAGGVDAPGELDEEALAIGIVVNVSGLSTRCTGDELGATEIRYAAVVNGDTLEGTIQATSIGNNQFAAQLPLALYAPLQFQAAIGFSDGSTFILPDNLGDPYYQVYTGHVKQLYCTDFESADPFQSGWTGTASGIRRRADRFAVGVGSADERLDRSSRRVLRHEDHRAGVERRLRAADLFEVEDAADRCRQVQRRAAAVPALACCRGQPLRQGEDPRERCAGVDQLDREHRRLELDASHRQRVGVPRCRADTVLLRSHRQRRVHARFRSGAQPRRLATRRCMRGREPELDLRRRREDDHRDLRRRLGERRPTGSLPHLVQGTGVWRQHRRYRRGVRRGRRDPHVLGQVHEHHGRYGRLLLGERWRRGLARARHRRARAVATPRLSLAARARLHVGLIDPAVAVAIELREPAGKPRRELALIDDAVVVEIVLVDDLLDPALATELALLAALGTELPARLRLDLTPRCVPGLQDRRWRRRSARATRRT